MTELYRARGWESGWPWNIAISPAGAHRAKTICGYYPLTRLVHARDFFFYTRCIIRYSQCLGQCIGNIEEGPEKQSFTCLFTFSRTNGKQLNIANFRTIILVERSKHSYRQRKYIALKVMGNRQSDIGHLPNETTTERWINVNNCNLSMNTVTLLGFDT